MNYKFHKIHELLTLRDVCGICSFFRHLPLLEMSVPIIYLSLSLLCKIIKSRCSVSRVSQSHPFSTTY
nr:MAG TPA: hypothetical protein [Caudoviricetes sp.]